MSIYDIWDSILAFFGIKKSITTGKKQAENSSYTEKYEDTSERNFTAVISNRVATLALSDSNVNIPEDNKRAKLLNDIMKKVWNKMQKNASLALGVGGALIVPNVQNGRIYFDIVTQDRLRINDMNGEDIVSATVLADCIEISNNVYYRFVNYEIKNNTLLISNKTTTRYGRAATVDKWKNFEDIIIANVEKVPFGYIKSPIDNRKTDDTYGVPVTYGCDAIIKEIKDCLKQIEEEFELKQVRLRVDERDLVDEKGKVKLVSKLFLKSHNVNNEDIFDIFDPAIKDSSYYNRLTRLLEDLEKAIGLSRGILTEPVATYENTQKIREATGSTWAVINSLRDAIEKGVEDFIYACNILANYYNLTPHGEYTISFDWDCSMLESSIETWNQMKDLQSIGGMSKAELRSWQRGETIEDAQKAIDEIKKNEPSLNTLMGMSE